MDSGPPVRAVARAMETRTVSIRKVGGWDCCRPRPQGCEDQGGGYQEAGRPGCPGGGIPGVGTTMASSNKVFSAHSCRLLLRGGGWRVGGTSLTPTGGVVRLGFPKSWWPISCYNLLGPWLGGGRLPGAFEQGQVVAVVDHRWPDVSWLLWAGLRVAAGSVVRRSVSQQLQPLMAFRQSVVRVTGVSGCL